MNSSLKELFERLGPVRAIDRVRSGSAATVALRPVDGLAGLRTVSGAMALARRGLPLMVARQVMDELIEHGRAIVTLPTVEDMATLSAELSEAGMSATPSAVLVTEADGQAVP